MTQALILCAGKGTRLLPLTERVPKPMVEIGGKPLLEYNVQLCKKYGIREILVNTSHLPEQIKEYFGNGSSREVEITYSYEPELLGTSGALNNFRKEIKGTFVVIYGDNLTNLDLDKLIKDHKSSGAFATLAVRKKPREYKTQSLIIADEDLVISEFIEKPSEEVVVRLAGEFKLVNSGIYVLEKEILEFIPQGFSDFAYDIFPKLLGLNKKIKGFIMDDWYFREVGKIEKYETAKEEIESGEVELGLW